jgi:hypothetical protein
MVFVPRTRRFATATLVAALGTLAFAAAGASAAPLSGNDSGSPAAEGRACGAPCTIFVYRKGDGAGRLQVIDAGGSREDPCNPSCVVQVAMAGDQGKGVLRPLGADFRGWEECPEPSGADCLIDVAQTGFITVCMNFIRAGSPPPAGGCPPAGSEPPTRDTTPPNTRLLSGPPATTRSRRATFRFSTPENGARFECRLDARAWSACHSPRTSTRLRLGRHVFSVRAIDGSGNRDASAAVRRWRILAPR